MGVQTVTGDEATRSPFGVRGPRWSRVERGEEQGGGRGAGGGWRSEDLAVGGALAALWPQLSGLWAPVPGRVPHLLAPRETLSVAWRGCKCRRGPGRPPLRDAAGEAELRLPVGLGLGRWLGRCSGTFSDANHTESIF